MPLNLGFMSNMPDVNPGRVLFSQNPSSRRPYLNSFSAQPAQVPVTQPSPNSNATLGPESIRATGSGPFDAAYRQNLATFAGGQFMRPGGNLSFNPTDPQLFGGQPSGAGTAPVTGSPVSLVSEALGGQPFSYTPPPPAPTQQQTGDGVGADNWRFWLKRMRGQGNLFPLMA